MAWETKPGQGQLFKNRDRKTEKHPNLKGTALLELADGSTVELDIAAWTRETRTGDKFLSLSVKLKGDRDSSRPSTSPAQRRPNAQDLVNGVDIDAAFGADEEDVRFVVPVDVSPERRWRV